MTLPQNRLPRRKFLRGAGVALSLPWLSTLGGRAARAATAAATPPIRSAFIYFPNGVWGKDWVPTSEGSDYPLSPSLEPLAEVREHCLVLTGLDKKNSHGGDGHYAKTANFLTGMPVSKTTGKDISSGGISIDQLLAKHVGGQTPLPSLELGTEPVITGVDSNVGYTRLYGSSISWETPQRPMTKEINPRVVYERLFGKGLAAKNQGTESYQNLLDFVLEDARKIRGQLGRDDQFKMDEYLDSVRAVERRIEFANSDREDAWEPSTDPAEIARRKPGVPADFREHIDIMLDLMVLAFQTDSTRVCSLMFANDVSGRNFSFVDGVSGSHHELSHHENKAEKIEQYQRINRWHVEQFARMLTKMKAVQEGEGTLLDHSMVVFGSSMSDGNRHDPDNLPILLGGTAGGRIRSGRHIAHGETPLCNLYHSMLDIHGFPVERFGDSTGPLELS
ncbi:DUF1552 domain-containing protein [Planctomycetaceae bacterium SH139]